MTEVIKISRNGIKLIVIKKNIFLFLTFILNLKFFKIVENIIKKGTKIRICFVMNAIGFIKWLIILNSDKPDLFKP